MQTAVTTMERTLDIEAMHTEPTIVPTEEFRNVNEVAGENSGEGFVEHGDEVFVDSTQRQLEDGRNADTVRNSLTNFRQSASRTTGQIRELLETSKVLDHEFMAFMQHPRTKAFLVGGDDDEDDVDNNYGDGGDDESLDNPKEIEALKQKTKSLKRKLRKWRKAARMALSEICPDVSPDAQGDMTPGTMKNVLQRIRQLKNLTDKQTSIILALTGQFESQKAESEEKDMLIMELLRNCNGIRPALAKGDQQQSEKTSKNSGSVMALEAIAQELGEGPGSSNFEGMITKKEPVEFPLSTAAEVEEVLTQTGIRFGSAHLIPGQINGNGSCPGVALRPKDLNPAVIARQATDSAPSGASTSHPDNKPREVVPGPGMTTPVPDRQAMMNKTGTVWMGLAVGAAAGLSAVFVRGLTKRFDD